MADESEEATKTGLSKKQLKKMAKMAEKQQKKAAAKAPAPSGGDPIPSHATPPAPAAVPLKKQAKLLLANVELGKEDLSSVKAVWSSLLYKVPLESTRQILPMAHGPALVYDSQVVMGGNSMAKAISCFGTDTVLSPAQAMQVDEWCEWERSHLRHSHNLHNALGHLEQILEEAGGSPFHLIGHETTVADICVVTTLSSATGGHHLPPRVATYLEAHASELAAAKEALVAFPSTGGSGKPVDLDDPSLEKVIEQVFGNALVELFGEELLEGKLPASIVSKCKDSKHGDYQSSIAMRLFSELKKANSLPETMRSPPDLANALAAELEKASDVVVELRVDRGFVQCRVAPSLLEHRVGHYLYDIGHLPNPQVTPQTCLVDFSSPNIAKEMHVGHLRSTILGEAMCRILERVGHSVHRVNHVGDWGTQFGMLIQYLKEEFPTFHESMPNITDLTEFYKNAKGRFDEVPEFKKLSQTNVVKLQSGDEECMEIWKILCDVSRKEFQKVYDRLDIKVEEYGESFYNDKIPAVVEEFNQAGQLSIEDGGAKCVFLGDKFQIPLMLQKSDGGYGYDSTDMTALKYRLQELKCQRIIVVTDFSQGDHFKMCYAAAHKIGWVDGQSLEHIGFGTVMGEDGKRFKTRSGDTVRLVDLLDEAVARMEASLMERITEGKANIALDEVHKVAEAMGYGAVKYFDLRRNPTSNYKFSYDQMLDTKGNTAVYLLYAHARLESICSKALADHGVDVNQLIAEQTPISIEHPSERNLAFNLQLFTDTLTATLDDLLPYHICEFLYNLAIAASEFVTQCKVLGSPEMKSRLLLCRATTMAMRECLDLLGIRHVERI